VKTETGAEVSYKLVGEVPKKYNIFQIVAKGYYGDMDEHFIYDQDYEPDKEFDEGIDCLVWFLAEAVMFTKMLKQLRKADRLETGDDMETWLQERGLDTLVDTIPQETTYGTGYLPSIEKLDLIFHDNDGIPQKVELVVDFKW
jgi:hypothetical protein